MSSLSTDDISLPLRYRGIEQEESIVSSTSLCWGAFGDTFDSSDKENMSDITKVTSNYNSNFSL